MKKQYLELIDVKKIVKKNTILVNVPTFNSYEITKKTIDALYHQKKIKFDILLLDNNSDDYVKLSKEYPKLNYLVTNKNVGSSGAQYIGGELAIEYKYKYIVFTDNDALLLDSMGIKKLYDASLKYHADGVFPLNIEFNSKVENECEIVKSTTAFHYLMVKTEFIKKNGIHPFDIFLGGDDIALTAQIISLGKLVRCNNVLFYHPLYSAKIFSNVWGYYVVRNLLYISLFNKKIIISIRLKLLLLFLYHITRLALYFIITGDISYIKTATIAINHAINKKLGIAENIPQNKITYTITERANTIISTLNNYSFLLLKENYKYCSLYLKKTINFTQSQ